MSRSYSLLVSVTVMLALCIAGGVVAYKVVAKRRFQSVQTTFNTSEARIQLNGQWGDATVGVYEDVPLDRIAMIETCGPVRHLQISAPSLSPQAISRLLMVPGLSEVYMHTGVPFSDDAITGMCQQGREIREINLQVHSISRAGLSRLAELPALERLKLDRTDMPGRVVSLASGFATLKKLDFDFSQLDLPPTRVEIAHLARLEAIAICGPSASDPDSAESPGPEVIITDLPNLGSLTVCIVPVFSHSRIAITGCPRLRRLAICQQTCDSRLLETIAASSPDLGELVIKGTNQFAAAEAAALAKFKHLETLELTSLYLRPALLAAIADMPHLKRLKIAECSLVPEGVDFDQWRPQGNAETSTNRSAAWGELARCRQLRELAFSIDFAMPDDLDWIKQLKSLRILDLAKCGLRMDTFPRWAPSPAATASIDLGRGLLVDHTLDLCAQMPWLPVLFLDDEQIEKIAPTRQLEKLQICKSLFEIGSFGWLPVFTTDSGMY
jgi:hypothetical protein